MSYIKPASTKDSVKRMIKAVSMKQYVYASIYAIAGGLLTVISALALQLIVSIFSEQSEQMGKVIGIIGAYSLVSMILVIITAQLERRTYHYYNFLRMDTFKEVLKRFVTMDYEYFEDSAFMDEAYTAVTPLESNNRGFEGIYHTVFELSKKFVGGLLLCVIVAFIHPLIIVIVLVYVALNLSILKLISNHRYNRRIRENELNRKIGEYSKETSDFAYGKDVRLFKMGNKLIQEYRSEVKSLDFLLKEITFFKTKLSILDIILLIACNFTTYYILGTKLYSDGNIANFVMFLTALNLFTTSMIDISKDIGFIRQNFANIRDMYGFLSMKLITEDSSLAFSSDTPIKVEFKNVSFKYPKTDRYIYEDLNLTIESGKKIALVGINGAGKTTLVKLLTGLYRPTKGQILINGVDYTTFASKDLQNLFGVVFQDIHPLAIKVKENIAATKENIDEDLVIKSLEQVGLYEKIKNSPKQLDTMLLKIIDEEGIVLSGGENQKLMIARALYRTHAKMMIMDEPTAALDALAEEKIYEEFSEIMGGKTGLFISHRLASTRFCDYIVLLDGGRVAEIGTHDELLEKNGIYANMFVTQGKYYQEESDNEEK